SLLFFFFQAEDGIRDFHVTGVQTCALPIFRSRGAVAEVDRVRMVLAQLVNSVPDRLAIGAGTAGGAGAQGIGVRSGCGRRHRCKVGRASGRERVWWRVRAATCGEWSAWGGG